MGVRKYQSYGRTLWKVDAWLVRPDGPPIRLRQSKIPTREQAVALEAKLKTDAFEGQFFERHRMATETTAELLAQYEKVGAQELVFRRSPVAQRSCALDTWNRQMASMKPRERRGGSAGDTKLARETIRRA